LSCCRGGGGGGGALVHPIDKTWQLTSAVGKLIPKCVCAYPRIHEEKNNKKTNKKKKKKTLFFVSFLDARLSYFWPQQ